MKQTLITKILEIPLSQKQLITSVVKQKDMKAFEVWFEIYGKKI